MSNREAFEKLYPVPDDAVYNVVLNQYGWRTHPTSVHPFDATYEGWLAGWKAAKAQPCPHIETSGTTSWCRLAQSQTKAGDGEAVAVTDEMALSFHRALTDGAPGDSDIADIKTGLRAALANVYTAPPAASVNRQYLIDLLIATRTQSEGVTADLIVKMIGAKPSVNQQLLEALKDLLAYLEDGIGDTESDEGLKARASIVAAQEQKA